MRKRKSAAVAKPLLFAGGVGHNLALVGLLMFSIVRQGKLGMLQRIRTLLAGAGEDEQASFEDIQLDLMFVAEQAELPENEIDCLMLYVEWLKNSAPAAEAAGPSAEVAGAQIIPLLLAPTVPATHQQ
jgi:hypothetical protein